ncbi:putative Copper transporter [Quillaja saponaria]|uniref:Copper transport protein n=1 Tax=Quillaja saponaria TaxID=32244 RepID=A0AAD7QG03_QUISA|nr:putative Copper transporter [Quillaja saponaria]
MGMIARGLVSEKYKQIYRVSENMNGMDGHMHDMNGTGMDGHMPDMNGTASPPMMMMHMTFFWGKNMEILFHNFPGVDNAGMYVLSLVFVFAVAFVVELLSHSRFIKPGSDNFAAGLIQTLVHAIRVGLSYLVMLAVMSFNGGVFLVAVAGHALGFLLFGRRVFKKPDALSDLP